LAIFTVYDITVLNSDSADMLFVRFVC